MAMGFVKKDTLVERKFSEFFFDSFGVNGGNICLSSVKSNYVCKGCAYSNRLFRPDSDKRNNDEASIFGARSYNGLFSAVIWAIFFIEKRRKTQT